LHSYALGELLRDVTAGAGLEKQFAGGQSTSLLGKTAHSGMLEIPA